MYPLIICIYCYIKERLIKDHQKQLHQLEQALAIHYQQIGQAHRDAMTVEQVNKKHIVLPMLNVI